MIYQLPEVAASTSSGQHFLREQLPFVFFCKRVNHSKSILQKSSHVTATFCGVSFSDTAIWCHGQKQTARGSSMVGMVQNCVTKL